MFFDVIGDLQSYFQPRACNIDNKIFELHYRLTWVMLIGMSLMVEAFEHFGDPIDCLSSDTIHENLLDNYCWIHTTYSIVDSWKKEVGVEVPYPGVDKYVPGERKIHHKYYQWVGFVLFFQALLFCAPRFFWKNYENGRLKNMIMDLNMPIAESEENNKNNRALLVEYLYKNMNTHNCYFTAYFAAESLNLINVVLQMFIMNGFLGGQFLSFGWEMLEFSEWDQPVRYDPLIRVFPRLTKCTFHQFGPSGDVQKHDAMCILSINNVNEKIYIFLWFWFYFLLIVSSLTLLYRLILVFVCPLRYFAIRVRSLPNAYALHLVLEKCQVGDWFLLQLLCKNLDPFNFRDIIRELALRFDNDGKID